MNLSLETIRKISDNKIAKVLIISVLFSLSSCSMKVCQKYNQTYSIIKNPVLRDDNSLFFVHQNVIKENSKYYDNFTIYKKNDNTEINQKVYSFKKEVVEEINEPEMTYYVQRYQFLSNEFPVRMFKDGVVGYIDIYDSKLFMVKDGQKLKEINLKPIVYKGIDAQLVNFTFDGKYLVDSKTIYEIDTGKITTININNDELEQKINVLYRVDNSDKIIIQTTEKSFYIADLDIDNAVLINHQKINSQKNIKNIYAVNNDKVIFISTYEDKNDSDIEEAYLHDLKTNNEQKLNFVNRDKISTDFAYNYSFDRDLNKILFRPEGQNQQKIIEMNLDESDKKIVIESEKFPSGDKYEYVQCPPEGTLI